MRVFWYVRMRSLRLLTLFQPFAGAAVTHLSYHCACMFMPHFKHFRRFDDRVLHCDAILSELLHLHGANHQLRALGQPCLLLLICSPVAESQRRSLAALEGPEGGCQGRHDADVAVECCRQQAVGGGHPSILGSSTGCPGGVSLFAVATQGAPGGLAVSVLTMPRCRGARTISLSGPGLLSEFFFFT